MPCDCNVPTTKEAPDAHTCLRLCACAVQLLLRGAGTCAASVRLVFDLLVHGHFPTPLLATHPNGTGCMHNDSSTEPRSEEEGSDDQCPECLSRKAIMKEAAVLPVIFSLVPALPPGLQVLPGCPSYCLAMPLTTRAPMAMVA